VANFIYNRHYGFMMEPGFCIECGAKGDTIEQLCPECFLNRNDLAKLPTRLTGTICSHCNALEVGAKFQDFDDMDDLLLYIISRGIEPYNDAKVAACVLEYHDSGSGDFLVQVSLEMEYKGICGTVDGEVEVILNKGCCSRCSRFFGNYFEAIIQVRGSDRKMSRDEKQKIINQMDSMVASLSSSDRNIFITKTEEIHGGLDFYMSSSTAARRMAKTLKDELGGKLTESSSLVGKKDGRDMYRMTYLVRLPEFLVGDIFKLDDRVYMVKRFMPKVVMVQDLETGATLNKPNLDLKKARKLGSDDEGVLVDIIYQDENEVHVLDPVDYQTVVLKKLHLKDLKDKVKVISIEEQLYLLPS